MRTFALSLVLAGVCGLALPACSSDATSSQVYSSPSLNPVQQVQASANSFCLEMLRVPTSVDDATNQAEGQGFTVRVVSIDDVLQPATRDYRVERVNFDVVNGTVTGCTTG